MAYYLYQQLIELSTITSTIMSLLQSIDERKVRRKHQVYMCSCMCAFVYVVCYAVQGEGDKYQIFQYFWC